MHFAFLAAQNYVALGGQHIRKKNHKNKSKSHRNRKQDNFFCSPFFISFTTPKFTKYNFGFTS